MLTPSGQLATVLLLTAVVLLTLGYRIRVRREWHLIAGFDPENIRDPEGLGRWVGSVGLLLGSITLGAAALALARPDLGSTIGGAYAAVICTGAGVMAVGCFRYLF